MGETIKPALTASEWEDGETAWPVAALTTTTGGDLVVSSDDPAMGDSVRVPAEYRHAVAALALYKQEYGFTHEDIEALRVRPHPEHDVYHPGQLCCDALAREQAYASLASRISALLPPARAVSPEPKT